MTQHSDPLRSQIALISGGTYSLDLSGVDQTQILYNGKFSYLLDHNYPESGGWCHLLLLRSKSPHSRQLLAIVAQTPDSLLSIDNHMRNIATFIANFFSTFHVPCLRVDEDEDNLEAYRLTPENTVFIEYLPAHCFDHRDSDAFSVIRLSWEKVYRDELNWSYKADRADWKRTDKATVNDLIARL